MLGRCQDPSNFTASSAYPLAPVRSPLKYNTWRVSCSENPGHFFSGGVLLITTGLSGSMFVCMFYLCQKKSIKHWKSIQIPVPLSQVTANFKNLACPDPPTRILKDSPPTASPLEFLRKGKRIKERWTRGLSQLKCQPSSRLLITAHLRSKNPSADRISLLKKCRVKPVVKTASLVSYNICRVEDVLRQGNFGQQLPAEIGSNTFRPIPSKCSMACATE